MGSNRIQLKVSTDYTYESLREIISKKLSISDFSYQIDKQSLDARKKSDIHYLLNVIVLSEELKDEEISPLTELQIPFQQRNKKVVVIGSGPAGFFSAHVLQKAGFDVTIIERGAYVGKRSEAINNLEKNGVFNENSNYAFGEGGAGTFSDGKLTSRSKNISVERNFILSEYIKAGAPEEIRYMSHPHLGTDNLKLIVTNLRKTFQDNGGKILFETQLTDLNLSASTAKGVQTTKGDIEADYVILATGHSAYETYRMLLKRGIQFRTKNFAIGHRIEHPQRIINMAQWGKESLPGAKAAEYRLSTKTKSGVGVYTFCMCPGGTIVPAAAYKEKSVVNGMSYYKRNGRYANAGCVAGVHPDQLLNKEASPNEILDYMDELESSFYEHSSGYVLPANMASDYLTKRISRKLTNTSYSLGTRSAPLYNMVPKFVANALSQGIQDFERKLKGFGSGMLMGLECKTSSPIQVLRDREGKCDNFDKLYFIGEGSGYAGGIISSAADGVKCALSIIPLAN